MPPRYNIQIWNRTDLSSPLPANTLREVEYTLVPNAFVPNPPPGLPGAGNGWAQGASSGGGVAPYAGEIIPAYACMKIAGAPLVFKNDLLWPVCLPDDDSMIGQQAALHFFNSGQPLQFMAKGLATQDDRAPVLVDLTADGSPYAGGTVDPGLYVGDLGIMAGSWALQPASNCINANNTSTTPITYWPYCSMGRLPSVNVNDPANLLYSWYVFIVGRGSGVRVSNPKGALAAAVSDLANSIFNASV